MSTKLPRLDAVVVSSEDPSTSLPLAAACTVHRVQAEGSPALASDHTAIEEPLQVCVDGAPFAVIMRTPGDDADLAAGFLLAESVIAGRDDIETLGPLVDEHGRARHNVIDLSRPPAVRAARGALARGVATSAACGLCGRQQIDSLRIDRPPVPVAWHVDAELVHALPARVRARQHRFEATGGLHAAALFTARGEVMAVAEDVGRHNAVDKVVGRRLREGTLPLADVGLFVSGRVAFEIVQKAALAGVGLVVAVSAPSSLAVELAQACGITLVGFVRDRRFNIYCHPERVQHGARVL